MSTITIDELRRLPKLAEFRFDIELENYEGEDEKVLAALVAKVTERNDSVKLTLWIPEPASTGYIASLVASLVLKFHITEVMIQLCLKLYTEL